MRARSSNCIFLPQKRGGMGTENLADKVIPKVSRSRWFFVRRAHQAAGHSGRLFLISAPAPRSLRTRGYIRAACTSPGTLTFVTHFSCPLYVSRSVILPTSFQRDVIFITPITILSLPLSAWLRAQCPRPRRSWVCELASEVKWGRAGVSPNFWTSLHKQKAFYCLPLQ